MNHKYPECLDIDLEQLAVLNERANIARKSMATPQSKDKILRRHKTRRLISDLKEKYGLLWIVLGLCVAGLGAFVLVVSIL